MPWIGYTQPDGSAEPGGGWEWTSGEHSQFTAWHSGQADNLLGDDVAFYWNDSGSVGWSDHIDDPTSQGFGGVLSAAYESDDATKVTGTDVRGERGNDMPDGGAWGHPKRRSRR